MASLKLLIPLALSGALYAQTHTLLIDRSGSMRPFYDSGLVPQLARDITDSFTGRGPVRLYAFGTTVGQIDSLNQLLTLPWGQDTYLDRAAKRAIDDGANVVWIITDNIEDRPEDGSAGNTEAFYEILRGSSVSKVVIFPLPMSPGTTGIAVYALLLANPAGSTFEDAFESELQNFLKVERGERQVEALRMKPLDKDTVGVVLRNQGAAGEPKVFEEGDVVSAKVRIHFQSKFDHLKLVNTDLRAVPAEARFSDASLMAPERRSADINPKKMRDLEPGEETAEDYEVSIDLGPIRLKPGLLPLLKSGLRGKTEEIDLPVSLLLEVPASNFHFREPFLKAYHADSMEEAKATGRIYGLDKLPILLSDAATHIETEVPFHFRVKDPKRGAVAVVLAAVFGLVVLALGIFAVVMVARRIASGGHWDADVADDYGSPVKPAGLDKGGTLMVLGTPLGEIRRSTFVPADGVELIDPPDGKAPISEGAVAKVRRGRQTFVVTFKRKTKAPDEGADIQVEPKER
jgi:hypothetical protein